ncbi:MAG: glycosyltransferase family 9 protein, partial [Bacteroidia bacterium]|nr:glycosyltransferase family 9 protein [Bacteroidia bacterium]
PLEKAVAISNELMKEIDADYIFIGTVSEKIFTDEIISRLENKGQIINLCGKTSLKELAAVFQNADLAISTDSGTAHLANALSTKTIVFFGAGDDAITSPVNKTFLNVIRSDAWCQRCVSNTCKLGTQICLTELKEDIIVQAAKKLTAH